MGVEYCYQRLLFVGNKASSLVEYECVIVNGDKEDQRMTGWLFGRDITDALVLLKVW